MTRMIVAGAGGRMGRMLVRAVSEAKGVELVGATESQGSLHVGDDTGVVAGIGETGVPVVSELDALPEADAVIDFTAPAATLEMARYAAEKGLRMVIGTTGFSDDESVRLRDTLKDLPVVMASNYSVGVTLALQLIRQAAAVLGAEYDAEIIEAHHRHKVDAPSGTALSMGQSVAEGRGVDLKQAAVYAREGVTGPRQSGDIGFAVIRAGSIVGEHTAMFAGDEERLEIRHVASDRMAFARGAVRAADWLMMQDRGWYDMRDVLGLT
ncbi:MAG TPA: 4-hydroxy-tetrahydrodipicolinate reductase [Mariprofundaceae bacterium]|nr:4-hydroxy-tetrahydrodipicolinate reductase [Mariprofundaceae bacterium]